MPRRDPHHVTAADPLLFQQFGWDWRWLSAGRVIAAVDEVAAELGRVPAGVTVAFDGRPSWPSVVAYLAIQAAGLTARPVGPGEALSCAGEVRWLPMPEEGEVPASEGLELLTWPQAELRSTAADLRIESGGWPEFSVDGQARQLAEELRQGPIRDVLVLAHPLSEPLTQLALAWALTARAAIVLEPQLSALRATTLWARPTVLVATAGELLGFGPELAKPGRRAPFGRLRAVLLSGGAAVSEADQSTLLARGITLHHLRD